MENRYPLAFISLFIACFSTVIQAQSPGENYVLSRAYRVRGGEEVTADKYWGTPSQVNTQVSYLDGLGKTKQTVIVSGNPSQKDLATKLEYNTTFKAAKNYLPVALTTADGTLQSVSGSYYNGANVGDPTSNFWTETLYDNSPLGRPGEQKAPGIGTGVRTSYRTNQNLVHGVLKWYRINTSGAIVTPVENYPENVLNVTQTLDEDGKQVEEFVDRSGKVVLKRVAGQLYTYYVYNDKGQLRFVLQPKYQDDANLDLYAFQYFYDSQGRVDKKRIPGQGLFTMEYYYSDMVQYVTDANNQKYYYKYDDLNREIERGTGTIDGNEKPLVKIKYDNYIGIGNNFDNELGLTDNDHFVGEPKNDLKAGLTTMISTRVLDGADGYGNTWLNTVMFYDKKGRLIQRQKQLYGLGGDSKEQLSFKMDFSGNILEERTRQFTSSVTFRLDKSFTYDHLSRLTKIVHTFFENSDQKKSYTHVVNNYNEVGLLSGKELHNGIQKLNFRYTPRGWIYAMQNNEGKTFKLDLRYNTNGNINNLSWQTNGYSGNFNAIGYDDANRLSFANGSPNQENNINYDKNGNLTSLNRTGAVVDNLTCDYTGTGNQLKSVNDGSGNASGVKNGYSSYSYDGNGNMTSDGNKGATMTYNFLNLPRQVSLTSPTRTVQYVYDGSGVKLKMTAPSAGTLYAGEFEYNASGTLLRIGLEEGQLIRTSGGAYEVNYYIRDHLGNVRMVLKEDGAVLQETDYYAFGLPVLKTGSEATNKYQYNGKEKQPETGWLDFGARSYMPEIGRWGAIDPLAEEYLTMSPYSFTGNMPFILTDKDGKEIEFGIFTFNAKKTSSGSDVYDYRKVEFGQLSKQVQSALTAFARTSVGNAYLSKYANAGDKVGDVTFNSTGSLAQNKLLFSQSRREQSTTSYENENNRLVMNIDITTYRSNEDMKHVEPFAISVGHEVFLHADSKDDMLIRAIKQGNFNSVVSRNVIENPKGVVDHDNYLNHPSTGQSRNMNLYVNQLKHILNPKMVSQFIQEHDIANKTHVGLYKK